MASARKLPSGNYRVNLFIGMENGKRKYKSFTAPTKKEAELLAAQYNVERKEKTEKRIDGKGSNRALHRHENQRILPQYGQELPHLSEERL